MPKIVLAVYVLASSVEVLFYLSTPFSFFLFFLLSTNIEGGGVILCLVHRTWGVGCSQFLWGILWLLPSNAFLMGSYIPNVLFSFSETLSMWGVLTAGVGDDC